MIDVRVRNDGIHGRGHARTVGFLFHPSVGQPDWKSMGRNFEQACRQASQKGSWPKSLRCSRSPNYRKEIQLKPVRTMHDAEYDFHGSPGDLSELPRPVRVPARLGEACGFAALGHLLCFRQSCRTGGADAVAFWFERNRFGMAPA